ncbi:MAG: copper-binding protein [Caulobacter sp.]|nr:copper-binding protein [Caulobacter sp.]
MKRLTLILASAAMATALAGCGEKVAEPAADAEQAAPAAGPGAGGMTPGMGMAGAMMAKGTGTVTAIDKTAGTITLDHGPIAEAKWPAMEMEFKATPASLLDTVKVGDKVSFELKMGSGTGEVTAIQPQ